VKPSITLRWFITLTITLLTTIATISVVIYYTELIKKDVLRSADNRVKDIFDRDKHNFIKHIQVGSLLELSQNLQFSYKDHPFVKSVTIMREKEVLASYEAYDQQNEHLISFSYPLIEHEQLWGVVSARIDGEQIQRETRQKLIKLYTTGAIILLFTFLMSIMISVMISNEVKKISKIIIDRFQIFEDVKDTQDFALKLSQQNLPVSFLSEIRVISRLFEAFLNLIKNTNARINKLENEAKLSKLAKDLSHDLQSPLGALAIVTKQLEKDQADILKAVTDRIRNIVKSLDQYRIDDSYTLILVGNILQKTHFLKKIEFPPIELVLSINADENILFNEDKLLRILSNIINNSVEASASKIIVETQKDDHYLKIIITDNGKGIPTHIQNNIFKTGFTYGKEKGSGLGLGQVREEMNKTHGSIEITSQVGLGTEVKLLFPLSQNIT
jgi:signal transduction histidine kinase